ncbi:Protein of unknown function [Propionibacterium freudenreichii]|nr:Protein of unknown function [Propionibacterium freudenreichii]
MNRGVVEATDY